MYFVYFIAYLDNKRWLTQLANNMYNKYVCSEAKCEILQQENKLKTMSDARKTVLSLDSVLLFS